MLNEQAILNNLLWRIVMNQGGEINLLHTDITNVPSQAILKVDNIPGTDKVKVRAVIGSSIITQTKRVRICQGKN